MYYEADDVETWVTLDDQYGGQHDSRETDDDDFHSMLVDDDDVGWYPNVMPNEIKYELSRKNESPRIFKCIAFSPFSVSRQSFI